MVSLFVYGTLMSSSSEHCRVAAFMLGDPVSGSVPGSLHVSRHGNWPLLVPAVSGRVHGEVLPVSRVPELWSLLGDYEVAWGYELRWLPFLATDSAFSVPALTCVWPWLDHVGPRVATGVWAPSPSP